ncbi:hypothetical protein ACJJTC_001387 [Scirpophaga incertulas]
MCCEHVNRARVICRHPYNWFSSVFLQHILPVAATQSTQYLIYNKSKMKAVLVLMLLACVVAVVYGDLVCGTNYCKQHPCASRVAAISCRTPSVYRPNHAGKCACCPACVTLLDEGAACKTYSKELGETPSAVCRDPLLCIRGVCTKINKH